MLFPSSGTKDTKRTARRQVFSVILRAQETKQAAYRSAARGSKATACTQPTMIFRRNNTAMMMVIGVISFAFFAASFRMINARTPNMIPSAIE